MAFEDGWTLDEFRPPITAVFWCHVERVGAWHYWTFLSTNGVRYHGPRYFPLPSVEALKELVAGWWTGKAKLGQARINSELARARIIATENQGQ